MMAWLMNTYLDQYIGCLQNARRALIDAAGYGRLAKVGQVSLMKSVDVLGRQIDWAERKAASIRDGTLSSRPPPVAFKRLPTMLDDALKVFPEKEDPEVLLERHKVFARLSKAGKVSSKKKTAAAGRNGRLGGLSRSRAKRKAAKKNGSQPKRPTTIP